MTKIEASVASLQGAIDTANAKLAAAEINGGTEPCQRCRIHSIVPRALP